MLALEPGGMLLQYRLIGRIGSGGMGDVWKAVDTRLNRDVAIKLIDHEHVADPERRRRLLREARLASGLNHPNTVTIYDVHSGEPADFIAMEYIRGVTLRQLLQAGRMSLPLALTHAIQIADGIAAAHASGIVHRDIKPGNIILADDGRARVLDFGLARHVAPESAGHLGGEADDRDITGGTPLTQPGIAMGTPAYMSPEQVLTEPADARSDVFSFGIVFYEMLSGVSPFAGENRAQKLRKLLHEDPPPLADWVSGIPVTVEAVTRTCLEKDPARRYADCAEVAAALREAARISALAHAETIPLTQPVAAPLVRRWSGRRTAIAAIALAAVLAAAFFLYPKRSPVVRQRGVAVLPFTSVTPDIRTQAFGLGLVMAVSSNILAAEAFQKSYWVVSPSEVLQAHIQSAREARQVFGIDLVVAGSIEVSGDQVRLTANLTDARSQRQMGSRQITLPVGDSLKLEDDLAQRVAELLELNLPEGRQNAIQSAGSVEPGAQDYYLRGRGYLQSEDLQAGARADSAIAEFQEALRRDPHFAAAHAGLSAAELLQFRATRDPQWITRAESDANEALRLGGRTAATLTSLAAIERAKGRYSESAVLLQEALRSDRRSPEVQKALAQTYEALSSPTQAEGAYREAIAIQPGNPTAYQDLGLFFYKLGRYAEAERSYERARELAPDSYTAWFRLGAVYAQTGRPTQAEAAYKQSLKLKANSFSYNNLAAIYFNQERYAEAIPYMEKAVELGPGSLGMLANLARTYQHVPSQAYKAQPVVTRALALGDTLLRTNPRDAATRANLAFLKAETGDHAGAAREIDAALALEPANSTVLFYAVMTYESLGRRDDALRAWHELSRTGSLTKEIEQRPELKSLRADPRFKGEK